MQTVTETDIPDQSVLRSSLADASFYDAYSAPLCDGTLSPTEIFLRTSRATPGWVATLMSIRNGIVRQLGLKDVGSMSGETRKAASEYQIGDRLGIFTVMGQTQDELLLGIDDSHLDVRVSVLKPSGKKSSSYVVSTVVHVHNWLGRIYMAPVGRIHPLVVRAMMRRTPI
jgi:hypothetical protein